MPDAREQLLLEPMAEWACECYQWRYRPGTSYIYNGQLYVAAHYAGRIMGGSLVLDRKGFQKKSMLLSDIRLRAKSRTPPVRYRHPGS